jgi:hypothetical protein
VGGAGGYAGSPGRVGDPPAFNIDAMHKEGSTVDRQAGMLVNVHPGLRLWVGWNRNPSLAAPSRMNNLHGFNS